MLNLTRRNFVGGAAATAAALGLAACGGSGSDAGSAAGSSAGADAVGAPEELISAAKEEGTLVVYGSCEEEYLAAATEHFKELYGIETQYQRLSTGEVQAKIEEENGNPLRGPAGGLRTGQRLPPH